MKKYFALLFEDIVNWKNGWYHYARRHLRTFALRFETQKDVVVDILMARRGTYQRPFLHMSILLLLVFGVTGAPIIANAYPGGLPAELNQMTPSSAVVTSIDMNEYGVQTQVSDKPRDKVETYTVKDGDTLAKIAETFGVSIDTIRWANTLKSDTLSINQEIQIPPVTGIVHKVREGENIQTIAKKYKTDSQKIVNFPFNDFADLDTFALNVGQTLIVPDGVQVQAPAIQRAPQMGTFAGGTGALIWPASGSITQYPIWYHMALDIANPSRPSILAADNGVVTLVLYQQYGYGQHVMINHGNGIVTLYGHMSEIYVKVGDGVARGQVIGRMGSTGRSTGTHLHFETRQNGVLVSPLRFLK